MVELRSSCFVFQKQPQHRSNHASINSENKTKKAFKTLLRLWLLRLENDKNRQVSKSRSQIEVVVSRRNTL